MEQLVERLSSAQSSSPTVVIVSSDMPGSSVKESRKRLCEAILSNNNVEMLMLDGQSLDDEDCAHVANLLGQNLTNLKRLSFISCDLSRQGVAQVCDMLSKNTNVTHFTMKDCVLPNDFCFNVATLQHLDLGCSVLDNWDYLFSQCYNLVSLRCLMQSPCESLLDLIVSSTSLRRLDLGPLSGNFHNSVCKAIKMSSGSIEDASMLCQTSEDVAKVCQRNRDMHARARDACVMLLAFGQNQVAKYVWRTRNDALAWTKEHGPDDVELGLISKNLSVMLGDAEGLVEIFVDAVNQGKSSTIPDVLQRLLEPDMIESCCKSLMSNTALTRFEMIGVKQLHLESFKVLCNTLSVMPNLTEADFSETPLEDDGFEIVLSTLLATNKIKSISMRNCRLESESIDALLDAMVNLSSLTYLDVRDDLRFFPRRRFDIPPNLKHLKLSEIHPELARSILDRTNKNNLRSFEFSASIRDIHISSVIGRLSRTKITFRHADKHLLKRDTVEAEWALCNSFSPVDLEGFTQHLVPSLSAQNNYLDFRIRNTCTYIVACAKRRRNLIGHDVGRLIAKLVFESRHEVLEWCNCNPDLKTLIQEIKSSKCVRITPNMYLGDPILFRRLCMAINKSKLQEVQFDGNNFGITYSRILSYTMGLLYPPALRILNNPVVLAELIRRDLCVRVLEFQNCSIGKFLPSSFSFSTIAHTLNDLTIGRNDLSQYQLYCVLTELLRCQELRAFRLYDNAVTSSKVASLIAIMLKKRRNLKLMKLQRLALSDENMMVIFAGLSESKTFKILDITRAQEQVCSDAPATFDENYVTFLDETYVTFLDRSWKVEEDGLWK